MIEEEDDAESGDDMIEMVTLIEMSEYDELQQEPEDERSDECKRRRQQKMAGQGVKGDGEISPQHVLHPVREIDEVHHPEHQRKAGGDQKEKDAELQAVEHLNDEERGVHGFVHRLPKTDMPIPGLSAPSAKLPASES